LGCGICGFVGMEDKQLISRMCESIKHRGPDRTDFYIDNQVSLGVDRLSVIDLATGNQPIGNEDGSIQIVFNGEVYNYMMLKEELEEAGHSFRTQSDTETIVHGYEEWGESVPSHLRGMFAFAIWDSTKKKLFLARDRFGKKPLYYAQVDGVFFFASELKAILQYEYFPREVNDGILRQYLTLLYIPSPSTIFRASRKLQPGNYLTLEKGEVKIREYWDLPFTPKLDDISEDDAVRSLYELLLDAVKVRLRSDVPLGAFLSGGIDSSVIVSLMKRAGMADVKTFSIGFHEAYYNEIQDARRVAEFIGTDHTERWAEPQLVSLLPKLVWHCDEPFGDSSMIPTYLVSEETRKDVTVALTGDGGDEIFIGYPFLADPPIYDYYKRIPRPLRRAGLRIIGAIPLQSRLTIMARRASTMDYGSQSEQERYSLRVSHLDSETASRLYRGESEDSEPRDLRSYLNPYFEKTSGLESLDAFDYVTIKTYLPEDILTKVDRMTMAVSLEGRCPMLDHKLAEFVSRLHLKTKLNGDTMKGLLRKAALRYNLVPKQTITKAKHGFGLPIDYWMRNQWKDVASSVLSPERSKGVRNYFDPSQVKKMLDDPFRYRDSLFAVISFALWHDMFMESNERTPYLRIRL
jgi:asparagine synthase (glutamine-hydrolysing)